MTKYYKHIDKDEYKVIVEKKNILVVYTGVNFKDDIITLGTMIEKNTLAFHLEGFQEMNDSQFTKYCLLGKFLIEQDF